MKVILTAVIFFLSVSIACSSPFLACDPSSDAIAFVEIEITRDSVTTVVPGSYTVVGADARLYDLVGFPNGAVKFRARWAVDAGLWSDWSDPLNAVKSGKPGNFRIK